MSVSGACFGAKWFLLLAKLMRTTEFAGRREPVGVCTPPASCAGSMCLCFGAANITFAEVGSPPCVKPKSFR